MGTSSGTPPSALCHFKPAGVFKLLVDFKLCFGSNTESEPPHAHSSFSYISLIFTPLPGKYCCLGYNTIKSQPTSEDCGLRETLQDSKNMRRDGVQELTHSLSYSNNKELPSSLYMTYWDVCCCFCFRCFLFLFLFFVLSCFVKSTFKIVMFCSKLFSFSKGRV